MDALAQDIGGVDAVRSFGQIRRYWWLALIGTLLGVVAGIVYTGSVAKSYSSTTLVEVLPPPVQTNVTGARINSQVNMDNELQFASSISVAESAKKLLKVDADASYLRSQLSVVVPPNTSFLQVTFSAGKPEAARAGSHAFAVAYINARTDSAKASIALQAEGMTEQLTALQTQLVAQTSLASAQSTSPTRQLALANVNILENQITNLKQRLAPLGTTETTAATVTTDADLPTEPSKPVPLLYIGGSLFMGLVFGLAMALLAARLDRTIRTRADAETRVGRLVLGEIKNKGKAKEGMSVLAARTGGDQFDRLRLRLDSLAPDRQHSILVCADGSGSATSFAAANIAAAEARAGREAVLICANPHSLAPRMFSDPKGAGLSAFLLGKASADEVVQPVAGRARLNVVVPGDELTDVFDNVPVERLAALIDSLVSQGKHVVVEAPNLGDGAQALELAHTVGVTVVVAELGRSNVVKMTQAFAELEQMGAYAPGVVVVPSLPDEPTDAAV